MTIDIPSVFGAAGLHLSRRPGLFPSHPSGEENATKHPSNQHRAAAAPMRPRRPSFLHEAGLVVLVVGLLALYFAFIDWILTARGSGP